ncbi:MAG: hypothetical protein ACYC9O_20270 [Candidatus Latescibacterota bacterium]
MNISDLGPLGGDAPGRSRIVGGREKTEDRVRVSDTGENPRLNPPEADDTRETAPRDVFRTSEYSRRIEYLAKTVEETVEEPRRDKVEKARERVASGYYNSEEFLGSLALRLINPGLNG